MILLDEAHLHADLATLAIPYAMHEHVAVFTVAESHAVNADIPGAHSKNLFLRDEGRIFWLLTVPADAQIDLKGLPAAIGCKRVSFGKAEDMVRLLGVEPGSVTPLSAINCPPGAVQIVVDAGMAAANRVNVHPLRNSATVGLSGANLLRLLRHWGHDPVIAPIPVKDGT